LTDHASPMMQQPLVGQGLLITKASWLHSARHTTLGRTPLHEWSARCRDLYLTTHNTHKWQTSMPPAGIKPTIPASKWLRTHTLNCAATEISFDRSYHYESESENLLSLKVYFSQSWKWNVISFEPWFRCLEDKYANWILIIGNCFYIGIQIFILSLQEGRTYLH